MKRLSPFYLVLFLALFVMLVPDHAFAGTPPLRCQSGHAVAGTSLYDDSSGGACKYVGMRYIFSTIVCQFVTMVNIIMSKLYCSIQEVVAPTIFAAITLYVTVYGVQILMGTAQLNASEMMNRVIKLTLVAWLVSDPFFGVSEAISIMFTFFLSFITQTTTWVVKVLNGPIGLYTMYDYNPGVTSTFRFLDDWVYNSLTGALSQSNTKVMGFFIALSAAMPSIFFMVAYWWISVVKMLMNTLIGFLMAVVAVAFLLGISPIFIGFLLFRVTYQYFDQWLRFMVSFSMQVMVSFAILTLWLYSLTMFAPFFNELSNVIFPYEKVIRPAVAIYNPAATWGLCPHEVYVSNNSLHVACQDPNFTPDFGTVNSGDLIPPSMVPQLRGFIFYVFYHLIALIIVSYGFAALQKNSAQIAKQLSGNSYSPILNSGGGVNSLFGGLQKAQGEAKNMMSKELFSSFDRKHNTSTTPYEQMVRGAGMLAGKR